MCSGVANLTTDFVVYEVQHMLLTILGLIVDD